MEIKGPKVKDYIRKFKVVPGKKVQLKKYDSGWVQNKTLKSMNEEKAQELLGKMLEKERADLAEAQELLAASHEQGILIVVNGMI